MVVGVEGLLPPVALVLEHYHLEVRVRALQLATQLEPDGTMPATLVLDHEQPPYDCDGHHQDPRRDTSPASIETGEEEPTRPGIPKPRQDRA